MSVRVRLADHTFEIERGGTEAEVRARAPMWNDLLRDDKYRTIFLSPTFYLHWLRAAEPGQPFVLFVRRNGELVGCAPMVLRRQIVKGVPVRTLTFSVPRTDLIIAGDRQPVVEAIVRYWEQTGSEWDRISMRNVPGRSGTLHQIEATVERIGTLRFVRAGAGPAECYLPATATWAQYLHGKGSHFQKSLRYQCSRVERLGRVSYRTYADPADADEALRRLFALEAQSWKADQGDLVAPAERACFAELARDRSGEFAYEVCLLEVDDVPIAGLFSLIHLNRFYAFATFYDRRSAAAYPGRPLFRHVIRSALENPTVEEISFIGNSSFVKSWAPLERTYSHCDIYNARPRSRVLALIGSWRWRRARRATSSVADIEAVLP